VKFSLWPGSSHAPADLLGQVRVAEATGWNLGADRSERADGLARIKTEVLDQLPA
jgi:hypothetical protein